MKIITFFFLITLICLQVVTAQNRILMLNGKTITAASLNYDFPKNILYYNTENHKRTKLLDGNEVFSFTDSQNKETIIYTQAVEEEFAVSEMRSVIQGEATALKEYNPVWPFLAGFGVGCASMCLPVNPMFTMAIPIGYNIGAAFMRPSGNYIMKNYPDLYTDDLFVYGFKQRGGNKILKRSAIGTVAGIAAGFTGMFLYSQFGK